MQCAEFKSVYIFISFSGPLWCCKLVTLPCEGSVHKNVIMFGFHHSITDNMSMLILCDKFLKALRDLIKGECCYLKALSRQHFYADKIRNSNFQGISHF